MSPDCPCLYIAPYYLFFSLSIRAHGRRAAVIPLLYLRISWGFTVVNVYDVRWSVPSSSLFLVPSLFFNLFYMSALLRLECVGHGTVSLFIYSKAYLWVVWIW